MGKYYCEGDGEWANRQILEARVYFLWRGAIKLLQDRWLLLSKSLFSEEPQSKTSAASCSRGSNSRGPAGAN